MTRPSYLSTAPNNVNRYLAEVSSHIMAVYGTQLVGIYTTGSLALGDFRPDRSDIDLITVVSDSTGLGQQQQLAEQLNHQVLPCPAAGLEFVLYPLATVSTPSLTSGYLLNLNTGRALPAVVSFQPADEPAFWYAIDRSVTYQSGYSLIGPPPQEIFAPLSFEELLPAVIASVESHSDPVEGHLLDNAVLNGCRARCFARDRRWYAKLEAADRTLPAAGRFSTTIMEAMNPFRAGRRENSGDLTIGDVREFLADTLRELRGTVATSDDERTLASTTTDPQ